MQLNSFSRKLFIINYLSSFIPGYKSNSFTAQVLKKQLPEVAGNQGAAEWSGIQLLAGVGLLRPSSEAPIIGFHLILGEVHRFVADHDLPEKRHAVEVEVLEDAFVVEAGQDREVEAHFLVHDLVSLVVVVIL